MWQVGRVEHRGSGGVVVVGPVGTALVDPDLVAIAVDVVSGHATAQELLDWATRVPAVPAARAVAAERDASAFLLDVSGPLPRVSLMGGAQADAWPFGAQVAVPWVSPMEQVPVDPTEWIAVEARLSDRVGAEHAWLPLADGAAPAGVVRIGVPGVVTISARGPLCDEVPAPPIPPGSSDQGDTITSGIDQGSGRDEGGAPLSEPGPDATTVDLSAGPEDDTPGPAPEPAHAAESTPEPVTRRDWAEIMRSTVASLSAPATPPASSEVPEPPRPTASDLNPEAFEKTITPALLEQLRREATHGAWRDSDSDADHDAAEQGADTSVTRTDLAASPRAFLVYAGAAPVEVDHDVVIGRDPSPHAVDGRPAATTLRVPSLAAQISRSHCMVMQSAPGHWAVTDLGSANGTLLRHSDGRLEGLSAHVAADLDDGDILDVGEGVSLEFRIRRDS